MTFNKDQITTALKEHRVFAPPPSFSKKAHIKTMQEYQSMYQKSVEDPESFWADQAATFTWATRWKTVLSGNKPFFKWFEGGKLNASVNCIDRHIEAGLGDKAAIIFEGEPGDRRTLSYKDLQAEVSKLANYFESIGIAPGERVVIYLPHIPEAIIAMQACARVGAPHCVVFGGFSSEALAERINDAEATLLITADGGWRRGQTVALKQNADEALKKCPTIKKVIAVKRTGQNVAMKADRDVWWHETVGNQSRVHTAKNFGSEHLLFILYTSGSTGKPKGIVHTTAGYLTGVASTAKYVFDLQDHDIYWCTADVGWVTGHSYIAYGLLANGATILMYEGAPNFPDFGRMWKMIEAYKVSIFYTAPTAIRAFMKAGDEWPNRYNLSSLRLLGSVGEPINPEAWMWYREQIGKTKCPIIDTWWQTETGSMMITPIPGCTPTTPGSATRPVFGIEPAIVTQNGDEVPGEAGGYLIIRQPWPSMLRTIWKDDERFVKQYWSHPSGGYFTGDGARRDAHGNFWILGRIDDVINVSGHRLSTMEIESALVSHPAVAEAAVVSKPHDIKGEAIVCFISIKSKAKPTEDLRRELTEHVARHIGSFAKPDEIRFADALPKTRSGKIMRRLLRDVAAGRMTTGDTSTLEDLSVLATLHGQDEA